MYDFFYGIVSCAMIILNKIAVSRFHPTSVLLFLQTFVTAHVSTFILVFLGHTLYLSDVKYCLHYVMVCLTGMYLNMKALEHNEIEFVLLLRGFCPIIIFPIEFFLRKIQMLKIKSIAGLTS